MGFDDYMDQAGLLYNNANGLKDTGDSAQMTGLLRFGKWLSAPDQASRDKQQYKLEQELDVLTYTEGWHGKDLTGAEQKSISYPGIYVRHPKPCYPGWASNPHDFSRDQQQSLVIAMGALKQPKKLWQIFWQHCKRFGFYQNDQDITGAKQIPDFATPDRLGEYIRAFWMAGIWPMVLLWPLLLFTDLSAFIGLMISFYNWRDPSQADDDGLIMSMLQAKKALPTPISFLIRKLFKWFRPGGYDYGMKTKHRVETGSPPFGSLWVPILEREL